jgi:hypothetical protein
VQITPQELGTVLAALRFWQKHGPKVPNSFFDRLDREEQGALNDIRTNCGEFPTDLGIDQIDSLSVRLNSVDPQYLAWRNAGEESSANKQTEVVVIQPDEVVVYTGGLYVIQRDKAVEFFKAALRGEAVNMVDFGGRAMQDPVCHFMDDEDWEDKEHLAEVIENL